MKTLLLPLLVSLLWLANLVTAAAAPFSTNANRLAYLDEENPFYPHRDFPKLITPQWIGEPGVEAVVILAIDDMRDAKKYENFLRPILDRLKKIDGRAPVSIFANLVTTNDTAQLQTWLAEGLSLEVHTLTHPCPLLQKGSFTNAWNTFHGCVDLLGKIPGNQPVAFRMPCCDSMNSPSPRFYAEIFNRTSPDGRFLQADSSVMCLLTDDFLKRHGVSLPQTSSSLPQTLDPKPQTLSTLPQTPDPRPQTLSPPDHFRRYFPTATNAVTKKSLANFGTYIEDYPYPYVINRTCWEFPALVPSDWEAFNAHGPTNAATVADWQLALDAVVRAQGVFTSVFHPHGWLRNDQIIQCIDYAERTYGKKVKFLTFKEAVARLNKNLLLRTPLWETGGYIQSVRLLDQNNDGYMDLVINHPTGGSAVRTWNATESRWEELYDPSRGRNVPSILWTQPRLHDGKRSTGCFGSIPGFGDTLMLNWICSYDFDQQTAWTFREGKWGKNRDAFTGLHRFVGHDDDCELYPGKVRVVLRDIDRDGKCELIGGDPSKTAIYSWSDAERSWKKLPYSLPAGLTLVNERGEDNGLRFVDLNGDGFDDLILSNEKEYAIYLWAKTVKPGLGWAAGWSHKVLHEQRGGPVSDPARTNAAPPRAGSESGAPNTTTPTNHLSLITNHSREIPPFVRSGPHRNNGAWFARGQLFIQNEDTAQLSDNVWRKSFAELIAFDPPPPKTPAESR